MTVPDKFVYPVMKAMFCLPLVHNKEVRGCVYLHQRESRTCVPQFPHYLSNIFIIPELKGTTLVDLSQSQIKSHNWNRRSMIRHSQSLAQPQSFHEVSFVDEEGRTMTARGPVVQELVRHGLQQLPARFLRDAPPPALVDHRELESMALIDMAKLSPEADPSSRAEELRRLAASAESWGMFFVTGHGVPLPLMASLAEVLKAFFMLSLEEKRASVGSYKDIDNLGYGRSFVKSEDQKLDWVDRLAMRVHPNQDSLGLRLWPQTPVDFRPVVEKYVEAARRDCDILLQALPEALMLERQSFLEQFQPCSELIVNVRNNYYPPCPCPSSSVGLSPHTDASAVTVLAQFDGVQGLEVLRRGRWVRAPAPEGALLVVAGDLLEIMSNGRVASPWHRAMPSADRERFSVALFYNPPPRAEIGPVVGGGSGAKPVYRKVVVEDYVKNSYTFFNAGEKTPIKYAKIEAN
ncbi:hypothetical protein Taro_023769 [Colocasia esculenta]|uniref:Fe2OG dioxygenase domain-containing protein n=1 Tax=Colocasia esculenta TaxID=4460 RepID=A0A843VFG9_COLES|nr:hypothetical protein [Colocasia esculenta]